jgi:hypothetical protein
VNYVDTVIDRLHKALADIDPTASIQPELAPLYALLVLTRGDLTTLSDVHDAWALARTATRPDHPDLVPFAELDEGVAEWDRPFMQAIHQVAQNLDDNEAGA